MTVHAVVFDIGNVLIEWQPERFYDSVIGPERRRQMFAELDLHAMNDKVDAGADFRKTVTDFADANTAWRDEIMMWHDRWTDMATPAIDASVEILRALRRNSVPVFALSNFGVQTFEIAKPVYPFLDEFDRPYISGSLGVTKPDPKIYQIVEDDSGVAAENLLFIDDRLENLVAAQERGWQVHHFDGAEGLQSRLQTAGLLPLRSLP